MVKKAELTIEEKLRLLYDLQLIDSRIDDIKNMRGELPLEVEDLEDEVTGLKTRVEKLTAELEGIQQEITNKKNEIEEAKTLIKKYTEQQKNVRNNREYNSITKEIEYQDLEIQLAEKRIRESKAQIEQKKELEQQTQTLLEARETHLNHKREELGALLAETEKEEKILAGKSAEYEKMIEERLLNAYKRIRKSIKNGLAIVSIERGASGGSFFVIPPQIQMEVATRKKIITDEHSGRILIDPVLANEEKEKMEAFFNML